MSEDQIKRMRKAELLESKRVLDMKLKSMNKVLKVTVPVFLAPLLHFHIGQA